MIVRYGEPKSTGEGQGSCFAEGAAGKCAGEYEGMQGQKTEGCTIGGRRHRVHQDETLLQELLPEDQ